MNLYSQRKLASLAGVVLACTTLCTFYAHSSILLGPAAYDAELGQSWVSLRDRNAWFYSQLVLLGVPMLIYAFLGLRGGWGRARHLGRLGSAQNWMAAIQGWTGILLVAFVAYHLGSTWTVSTLKWLLLGAGPNPYAPDEIVTVSGLMISHLGQGFGVVLFYALGLFAAAYHVAYGVWNFSIDWGITSGERAIAWSSVICALLFAVLMITGYSTLGQFVHLAG